MRAARALARGPWRLDDLRLETVPSSRLVEPVVEALVDRVWAEQCAAGELIGWPLHDAPAYRVESVRTNGGRLDLGLASEPYRVHSAMKLLHADPRVTPAHHDRVLVVDSLVRTADDAHLLVRMPKVTGFELQLIGGTATPEQQVIETPADLATFALHRVGLALEGAAGLSVEGVLGVVEHLVGCVNLVLDVRTTASAREVSARGRRELHVVAPGGLEAYLRGSPGYLPAVADLL